MSENPENWAEITIEGVDGEVFQIIAKVEKENGKLRYKELLQIERRNEG